MGSDRYLESEMDAPRRMGELLKVVAKQKEEIDRLKQQIHLLREQVKCDGKAPWA